jgi:DNA repair exonuclease SbcCD nuclease subunit
MHFGYRRFEKDAYLQGKEAILSAAKEADVLILGGDNFDSPIPKFETIKEVISILKEAKKIGKENNTDIPIFSIHGNHDRRAKWLVNPNELLAETGLIINIHNRTEIVEKNGEKIAISGMGYVPDDLAAEAMKQLSCKKIEGAFNIFVLHQSFQEHDISGKEEYLTFDDLPQGFDLYLCGHTHKPNLKGKVLNPGSTVVTQLRENEAGQRGWLLYDTKTREAKFMPIKSRTFIYKNLNFEKATPEQIKIKLLEELNNLLKDYKNENPIIKIVLRGTMSDGFQASDFQIPNFGENVFIENFINSESLKEKIEQIKKQHEQKIGIKELGIDLLRKNLAKTNYDLWEPDEVFEALLDGSLLSKIKEKIENESRE